jgi:plastocyanin
MPHTVVAQDGSFRSKALDTDQTFSHTFTEPGEFVYFCSIHASMIGKVVVERP